MNLLGPKTTGQSMLSFLWPMLSPGNEAGIKGGRGGKKG
jgi:hypothetical protein